MITNLLLEFGLDVGSIIMILLLVCLVGLWVLGTFKRKKADEKLHAMRDDLKVGDKVMTDTGIYGEIVSKRTQDEYTFVTIKTGEGDKAGYLEVIQEAVYYTFNKDGEPDFAGQSIDLEEKETTKTENVSKEETASKEEK